VDNAPTTQHKRFTTSDGVTLHYADTGVGAPVVLLHGMLCHSGHWALQTPDLIGAGYRVIAPDMRFHGASDSPGHGHRVSRLGQDLGELLDHEGLERVALVGHSMGVSVALAYMSLRGSSGVGAFVSIDQAPRIVNDDDWPWGVRHVTWQDLEEQVVGKAAWSEPEREPSPPPHVLALLEAAGPVEDFFQSSLALRIDHFVSDWRDVLPTVDAPTWVVTGAHSPSFPLEGMQWMSSVMPRATLSIYGGSGHCPQWNEHELFNRDLMQFLAGSGL